MRERGRLVQGFYPTQDRVVAAIAKLVKPAAEGNISVVDAGCGEGAAIAALKEHWGMPANVKLFGIESDKGRADVAEKVLDEVLHANIEDTRPSAGVSLLWANPPYDQVRGDDRLEEQLFDHVKSWPMRKKGLLVLIVPKAVLHGEYLPLAEAVEREYEVDAVYDYPLPERDEFGQCVLIGHRREKESKTYNYGGNPAWAEMDWPTLPLNAPRARWTLEASANVTLRRQEVPDELLLEVLERSPLKHSLLREALAAEPPLSRPPLPLRAGHVALLLAGGLCDSVIDDKEHGKFMIKGKLNVANRKIKTEEKTDTNGELVAMVDTYRMRYELAVKVLREGGEIEAYTSEPPEELVNVDGEQEEA